MVIKEMIVPRMTGCREWKGVQGLSDLKEEPVGSTPRRVLEGFPLRMS
jgi:hypothetical protein